MRTTTASRGWAIWNHYGDLADHVRGSWIRLIVDQDLILQESLKQKVEAMRSELAGIRADTHVKRGTADRDAWFTGRVERNRRQAATSGLGDA